MTETAHETMRSLVYVSTAQVEFDDEALQALLVHARAKNAALDVTGMLLYRDGQFIQMLEGPDAQVHDVFDRIAADARHADVRVLVDAPIAQRAFADWTMGFEPITTPDGPPPEGFRDTFDDLESADAELALRAVRELSLWYRVRAGAA